MIVLAALAVSCVLKINLALADGSEDVDYSRQDEWRGKCNTGSEQSPIDIDITDLIEDENLPDLKISIPDDTRPATVTNIGYTAEFNFSKNAPTLSGGDLKDTYILRNLYFHWPSEHTVNGQNFPLESHWVHYNERYSSLEEASEHEDGILYLVTFYNIGIQDGLPAVDQLADAIRSVSERAGSQNVVESLSLGIPLFSTSNYEYRGSRSVPPCNENITYIILEEPILINEEQYHKMKNITNQDGELVKSNNRHTQPLNGRKVHFRYQ